MKTRRKNSIFSNKAASVLAVFVVFAALGLPGQTIGQSTPPEFCANGYPEDPALYEQCLEYEIANSGTEINNPVSGTVIGSGTGTWGMASAEDPTSGTIIFVSSSATASAGITATIHDADTLERVAGPFVVVQTDTFVGGPEVVYNPTDNRYLVVWSDSRRTGDSGSVFGRFVNPDGTMPDGDFPIHNEYNVLTNETDLSYDALNNEYVIGASAMGAFPVIRTVTSDGTVSPPHAFDLMSPGYEGMMTVIYNPAVNEYWYVTADIEPGTDDTLQENTALNLHRVARDTMQIVGEPIQLNPPRAARNGFRYPQIDYSPIDGAAVVVWQEMGRTPGQTSEVMGRTVYNDLTMSQVYPVLTPQTATISGFYGTPESMKYNPTTGTFMMVVEDGIGGTTYAEIDASGLVLEAYQAIPQMHENGNFWPSLGTANGRALSVTSPGYGTPVLAVIESNQRAPVQAGPAPSPTPRVPDELDSSGLSALVSQVYLWALGLSGLLAVTVSVWGGYLVMTARGNGQQAARGKSYLYSALMGLVLLLAAYLILNTINPDLTDFSTSLDTLE